MPEDFTLRRLRVELLNDPVSLGYHSYFGTLNWTAIGDLINTPSSQFLVSNPAVTPGSLVEAIQAGDFALLSSLALQQLQVVLTVSTIDLSTHNGFALVCTPFPENSQTRRTLADLALCSGSRSEMLFGAGFACCLGDLSTAITGISSLLSFL